MGTQIRKAKKVAHISEDTHAKLVKLSQSSKMDSSVIVGYLVDLCVKFDFLSEGWEGRLNEALKDVESKKVRDRVDKCPALAETNEDGFVCCINAPTQKKLGDGEPDDMLAVCGACDRLGKFKTILELARKGTEVKIPQCGKGGKLRDDKEGPTLYCPMYGDRRAPNICEKFKCKELSYAIFKVNVIKPEDNL